MVGAERRTHLSQCCCATAPPPKQLLQQRRLSLVVVFLFAFSQASQSWRRIWRCSMSQTMTLQSLLKRTVRSSDGKIVTSPINGRVSCVLDNCGTAKKLAENFGR